MLNTVEIPVWVLVIGGMFAAIALTERLLFPSVRWFFRKRFNRAVGRLNDRLQLKIQPFKLTDRRVLIDRLVYDPEIAEAIITHATQTGEPVAIVSKTAERYAREIVPRFSTFAYFGLVARILRWISQSLYRVRLGYLDEAAMDAVDPDSTVVFVINHRSNMDYVLVTYLASDRSALSYAVGEWARIWPLSGFIRSMGAFFIRRKSLNPLYRKVLARYVQMATAAGVTQAIFPEGGLSRDGKLGKAKLGLLSYIVAGYTMDSKRDVVFVPVGLNYDRVLEDRVLLAANKRTGKKSFRFAPISFFKFFFHHIWLRLLRKYHRFGYACVSFGQPMSLREFLGQNKGMSPDAQVENLGVKLMRKIGDVVPVLPVSLIAKIMIDGGLKPTSIDDIRTTAHQLWKDYAASGIYSHIPRDDEGYAVEVGLRMLTIRHILSEQDGMLHPNPENANLLEYYANAIAHLPYTAS
ncbi:MAG: 1-acyl-sn-glycerol-3-phosphate acyltransferase [Rhodobacteraceae bacterium]|nr:1-acyl-sn-glycerol-3-phosphate acyltransferase [Paracoccaceae bacterium]